jgi:hypothetical protein
MESNMEEAPCKAELRASDRLMENWEAVVAALPADLEASAVRYEALLRKRGIGCAVDLIHLVLGYSVLDKSLEALGSWAVSQAITDMSAPGLYERLCNANQWVGRVLFQFLEQRRLRLPKGRAVQVEIRDATVISRPGSKGTDWRIHLNLDLGSMSIRGVELTDAKGGESLVRFASEANRIVLADRIHANRKGLTSLLASNSWFAIRMTWQNLPLEDGQRQSWQVVDWLKTAFADPHTVFQEQRVYLRIDQRVEALRVCAVRLSKEAAEVAVRRAREQAKKNGHTPDERTLFAAQFILVVTNLPLDQWSTQQVLELYRVRWQVELFFKRLKSILDLDQLRAKKAPLAQTYLLGKLLAACLLDALTLHFVQCLPAGFASIERPLSYWALVSLLWEHFQNLIRGPLSLDRLTSDPTRFQRFLCPPPRKRQQQLAAALHRLQIVSAALPDALS